MRLWMRLVLIRYKISDFFSGLLRFGTLFELFSSNFLPIALWLREIASLERLGIMLMIVTRKRLALVIFMLGGAPKEHEVLLEEYRFSTSDGRR
jgi:hypothetical protein